MKLSKNYSGFILITVLWILAILAALAVSLSRQAFLEISLTRYATGNLRAKYQAWAGVVQAIELIRADSQDEVAKKSDTLYACGIVVSESTPDEIFRSGDDEGGDRFVIAHEIASDTGEERKSRAGFTDEERLLNLNALTLDNRAILTELLVLLGISENDAGRISAAAVDWKDQDNTAVGDAAQKENEYFTSGNSLVIKNRPFDTVEEFALLPGVTPEIYRKVRPYLTVFPKTGNLRINFDTAPGLLLRAVARGTFGSSTGAELADAENLAVKMADYRLGDDGEEGSVDDRVMEWNEMNLNVVERALAFFISQYRAPKSDYFRVVSQGIAGNDVAVTVEAVIRRDDLAIVSWRRR